MTRNSQRRRWSLAGWALGLFACALVIGLAINAAYGSRGPDDLTGDEPDYHALGARWADAGEYGLSGKLAYRAPAYPLLLGSAYRLFGEDVNVARGVQSVLAAGMVVLAFLLGVRLAGKPAGLMAALLVMLDSFWWSNQWSLMQENLQSVLTVSAVLLVMPSLGDAPRPRRTLGIAGSGFLFGLGLLAKPSLVPALLCIWLLPIFVRRGRRRAAMLGVALFCLVAALPVSAWAARNYHVFGRVLPLTTNAGRVFCGSHCSEVYAGVGRLGSWYPTQQDSNLAVHARATAASPPEAEWILDQARWRLGWATLRQQPPATLARQLVLKWLRAWSPSAFFAAASGPLRFVKALCIAINAIVILLFWLYVLQRRSWYWVFLLLICGLMLTVTLFWGTSRLRYPLSPMICACAAAWLVTRVRTQEARSLQGS
jgi:hypothetical protein